MPFLQVPISSSENDNEMKTRMNAMNDVYSDESTSVKRGKFLDKGKRKKKPGTERRGKRDEYAKAHKIFHISQPRYYFTLHKHSSNYTCTVRCVRELSIYDKKRRWLWKGMQRRWNVKWKTVFLRLEFRMFQEFRWDANLRLLSKKMKSLKARVCTARRELYKCESF